jgi:flagellar biosynthetic protein FliR
MTTLHLDRFLSGHVFAFLLIFSRVGTVMMLFPGIGEVYVPQRMRLMFALSLSFLLLGPLLPRLPPPPAEIADMTKLIAYEIVIGAFFGTILRLMLNMLETAGMVVGIQSGLSNATVLNPALASQSTLPSTFLSVTGVTLIFASGLDRLLFRALASLYDVFPPGAQFMPGDMAQTVIATVDRSFVIGIELAMPFFVMGLLMYVALGLMQKLLPQVQLFLVLLPVQIWGGLFLLSLTVAGIMTVWLRTFDASLDPFLPH